MLWTNEVKCPCKIHSHKLCQSIRYFSHMSIALCISPIETCSWSGNHQHSLVPEAAASGRSECRHGHQHHRSGELRAPEANGESADRGVPELRSGWIWQTERWHDETAFWSGGCLERTRPFTWRLPSTTRVHPVNNETPLRPPGP